MCETVKISEKTCKMVKMGNMRAQSVHIYVFINPRGQTKCTHCVHFVQKHAKTLKMAKIAIFRVFDVFESIWKPVEMLRTRF